MLERHRTVIDNEYEQTSNLSDFVSKHVSIDLEMKNERGRNKSVQRTFLGIDIIVSSIMICVIGLLWYVFFYAHDSDEFGTIHFIIHLCPPILDSTFSLILVLSAFYLAKSIRKSTGRK